MSIVFVSLLSPTSLYSASLTPHFFFYGCIITTSYHQLSSENTTSPENKEKRKQKKATRNRQTTQVGFLLHWLFLLLYVARTHSHCLPRVSHGAPLTRTLSSPRAALRPFGARPRTACSSALSVASGEASGAARMAPSRSPGRRFSCRRSIVHGQRWTDGQRRRETEERGVQVERGRGETKRERGRREKCRQGNEHVAGNCELVGHFDFFPFLPFLRASSPATCHQSNCAQFDFHLPQTLTILFLCSSLSLCRA